MSLTDVAATRIDWAMILENWIVHGKRGNPSCGDDDDGGITCLTGDDGTVPHTNPRINKQSKSRNKINARFSRRN